MITSEFKNKTNDPDWKTVNTPVFQFITAQLEKCQNESLSALLCDLSDIGKTFTAQHYTKAHKHAVYVDCSQVKSKQKLIRYIAKEFGVSGTGKYADVYEDLVFYLKTLPNPLIIFDEAGDLQYDAFMEIKALWNATEMACGYYMMGADGLSEKIRRSINCKKVGYTEVFSRFGKRFGQVIPVGKEESRNFMNTTAAMIIKANAPDNVDVSKLLKSTLGEDGMPSLRRIYKEIRKTA
jgi:DNA transposition AAA+ family ATPase